MPGALCSKGLLQHRDGWCLISHCLLTVKSSLSGLDQRFSASFDMLQQQKGRDGFCLYWRTENGAIVTQPALTHPLQPLGFAVWRWRANIQWCLFKQRGTLCTSLYLFWEPRCRRQGWALSKEETTKDRNVFVWVCLLCQQPWGENAAQQKRGKKHSQSAVSQSCYWATHQLSWCIYQIFHWTADFWARGCADRMRSAVQPRTVWVELSATAMLMTRWMFRNTTAIFQILKVNYHHKLCFLHDRK